jgi:hypothetical protein
MKQITMDAVESSQIHGIGHEATTSTLAIQFKNSAGGPGSLYHYENVDVEMFDAFRGADSIGSFFYKNIKPFKDKYPYVKVESAPAAIEGQA